MHGVLQVASHVPASEVTRGCLLAAPSTVARLRMELQMLKNANVEDMAIVCENCGTPLAALTELVVMSEEGASGVYVNPHGVVHDMLTVGSTEPGAIALQGTAQTEHSWFPGYAWTIAYCSRCFQHLAGGSSRTGTRPTLCRRIRSARLYEFSP